MNVGFCLSLILKTTVYLLSGTGSHLEKPECATELPGRRHVRCSDPCMNTESWKYILKNEFIMEDS